MAQVTIINTSAAAVTATLPDPSAYSGKSRTLKRSGGHLATVAGHLDGSASSHKNLEVDGDAIDYVSDGTTWRSVADSMQGFHSLSIVPDAARTEQGSAKFYGANGVDLVQIEAPASVAAGYTMELPTAPPTDEDVTVAITATLSDGKVLLAFGAPTADGATGVTASVSYGLIGNAAAFSVSGSIALPTDPSGIDSFVVELTGPTPSTALILNTTLRGPFAGSSASYSLPTTWRLGTAATYGIRATSFDADGLVISSVTTTVNVTAAAVTAIYFSEVSGGRYRTTDGNYWEATKLRFSYDLAGDGPVAVPTWYYRGSGKYQWCGIKIVASSGATADTDFDVILPHKTDGSWTAYGLAMLGETQDYSLGISDTLPSGVVPSTALSVPRCSAASASSCSGAAVGTLVYTPAGLSWLWGFPVTFTWDFADIYTFAVKMTIQKGHLSGGTWIPATDAEGAERECGHVEFLPNNNSAGFSMVVSGSSGAVTVAANPTSCIYPPATATDRTFRLRLYGQSRRDMDDVAGGKTTDTLLTAWSGGADHADITPLALSGSVTAADLEVSETFASNFFIDSYGKLNLQGLSENQIASVKAEAFEAYLNATEFEVDSYGTLKIKALNVSKLTGDTISLSTSLTINSTGNIVFQKSGSAVMTITSSGVTMANDAWFEIGGSGGTVAAPYGKFGSVQTPTIGPLDSSWSVSSSGADVSQVKISGYCVINSSANGTFYSSLKVGGNEVATQSWTTTNYMPIGGNTGDVSATFNVTDGTNTYTLTFTNGRLTSKT